jgi:hypothetical protein
MDDAALPYGKPAQLFMMIRPGKHATSLEAEASAT